MTNSLEEDVQHIVASMDNKEENDQDQEPQPEETIHIHYFPDAIVILKEDEQPAQVVESTPIIPQKPSLLPAYLICSLYLLLIVASLTLQYYCIFNPPIAKVTIIPKSQTVTLTGTVQLGQVLNPLTISQSQTTATTGHGHQDAKQATGYLTFYNGQFQSVTIAAGTIFTGEDGIQISTDQDATIPPGNPPSYGQITIAAHAINAGMKGNISAYDINQACCATSVLAKNTRTFIGGLDERDFSTVSTQDIHSVSTALKAAVTQSMQGALERQLKPQEQLFMLPCTPSVASDHPIGAEAATVKVTVSLTCSAVAYNSQELQTKATNFLTHQALVKLAGYNVFGNIQVSVKQASLSSTSPHLVFLAFHAYGTWIYGLSDHFQQLLKRLIAGRRKDQALRLLSLWPGIVKAVISWGDETKLPKNTANIHLQILVSKT